VGLPLGPFRHFSGELGEHQIQPGSQGKSAANELSSGVHHIKSQETLVDKSASRQ
jgi:hypothetical protein